MVTARFQELDPLDAQVRMAPFIFTGRILKPEGSTVAQVAGQAGVGVVRVDAVLRSPAVLGQLEGRSITLRFADGKPTKPGTRAMFFASSWVYAEGLAVVEVGRAAVPKDIRQTRALITAAELRVSDEPLLQRLRQALLVVTGRVELTRQPPVDESHARSEHDPLWQIAEIAVERTEKGALREPRLEVSFPSSLDEYWLDVAKLVPGQKGIFILHKEANKKRTKFPAPAPALMHALDFQPTNQIERVRLLLKLLAARG
jgi:hypothetical protein